MTSNYEKQQNFEFSFESELSNWILREKNQKLMNGLFVSNFYNDFNWKSQTKSKN